MTALQRTPLYSEHAALGARLVPFAGWEMPVQYAGVKVEHQAVRNHAGLFDVSHMGELRVVNDARLGGLNRLITNDLAALELNSSLYTCCCNESGGVLDDLIIYRTGQDEALVVCNASNRTKIVSHFEEHLGSAHVQDESSDTALLALQGPKALSTLCELLASPTDLAAHLPKKALRRLDLQLLGTTHSVAVARTGYTGEDGVEIFCDGSIAAPLFRALVSETRANPATPCGLAARDTLRLECKMALYGNELSEDISPLEAGLSWCVKLDKATFVGKQALVAQASAGLSKRLVGFEMKGRGIARAGYPLLGTGGEVVGVCSSGSPSPTLGKNIGLGFLPLQLARRGTQFSVDCRGRAIAAEVVATPFYRRA